MANRVLICSPVMPEFDRESGSRRVFDLIELLRASGWHVSFACQANDRSGRYARILQQRGVATYTGLAGDRALGLVAAGRFDLAICAFWYVAESFLPIIRAASPKTRVVVDTIDLHFVRNARRAFRAPPPGRGFGTLDDDYGGELARELNTYAAADGVWTVSAKEAELVNDLTGQPLLAQAVPDCEQLHRSRIAFERRRGILFVGNFRHPPNVEGAEYVCREVVPRLCPSLLETDPVYVVGNALDDRIRSLAAGHPQIRMVGWVPSVLPYLERARLSVIPLFYGAGTKRKLIQSLMVGTPTVSTRIGAEGLNLVDGRHVLLADDPDLFADSIARLARDQQLWSRLARNGRAHISKAHGRRAVRLRLIEAVREVLAREPKAPPCSSNSRAAHETTYRRLIDRIREAVRAAVPPHATILVVSKGDDELLAFDTHRAWHFPQLDDGTYAGCYPADCDSAIRDLERLRSKGADFLLFPQTAFWWLEHYRGLRRHLADRYQAVPVRDESCLIIALREPALEAHRTNEPALAAGNPLS